MPLFDLSTRTKLRLSGSDRVRFLNGQITNDARKANANASLSACVLTAKGKLDAFVFMGAEPEAFLLDADPELRGMLAARLERYVIADDVTIEDVTDEFALFHVTGAAEPAEPNDAHWRRSKRFGETGWDLFVRSEEHDQVRQLLAAQHSLCDADEAERWRIEQGIPRWGRELTDQIIPVEANLADETVDYAKGCYIGQEVISRMKMSGQTNKRLCGLVSLDGTALTPDLRLFAAGVAAPPVAGDAVSGREAGWITSAIKSDRLGKEIALGFVKRGFNEPGTRLLARTATDSKGGSEVEVYALPFAPSA